MKVAIAVLTATVLLVQAQQVPVPAPAKRELERLNYHRVTSSQVRLVNPGGNHSSTLTAKENERSLVQTPAEWYGKRRPELLNSWMRILERSSLSGRQEVVRRCAASAETSARGRGYTGIDLDIPIEKDFYQRHRLLPKGQGAGPSQQ
ncbi:MAG: hypothetical protein WKF37_21050 [Bryobacteraceae bacterium]